MSNKQNGKDFYPSLVSNIWRKIKKKQMILNQMEERLERANALLGDISRGEYGETLDDVIQWRIVKYFDDIDKNEK
jgi:hypothetical protein